MDMMDEAEHFADERDARWESETDDAMTDTIALGTLPSGDRPVLFAESIPDIDDGSEDANPAWRFLRMGDSEVRLHDCTGKKG
jgi:hypothetical protein